MVERQEVVDFGKLGGEAVWLLLSGCNTGRDDPGDWGEGGG